MIRHVKKVVGEKTFRKYSDAVVKVIEYKVNKREMLSLFFDTLMISLLEFIRWFLLAKIVSLFYLRSN